MSWKKRINIAAGVLVTAFAVYCLAGYLYGEYRLRQEIALLRAAGEPVTPEELAASYAVPAGEVNVTPAWQDVFDIVGSRPFIDGYHDLGGQYSWVYRESALPLPGEEWDGREQVEAFLAKYPELMGKVPDGAEGMVCFLDDFSSPEILLQHVDWLRILSRLLLIDAFLAAHDQDADRAKSRILDVFAAAEALDREPLFVTQIVRRGLHGQAILAIERLLPDAEFQDEHLTRFQESLRRAKYQEGLRTALRGQRVLGLVGFDHPITVNGQPISSAIPAPLFRSWVGDHPANFLESMREFESNIGGGWPELTALARAAPESTPTRDESVFSPFGGVEWARPGNSLVGFQFLLKHFIIAQARARAADAAIGAWRYRLAHGQFPESLDVLVPVYLPDVPEDPCDGAPLRYRFSDTELVVYSVGIDGEDNGGQEIPEIDMNGVHRNGEPDVVFRIELGPSEGG